MDLNTNNLEIELDNGSLTLKYQDLKQLFKDLLEIHGYSYEAFACKFDLSDDAVSSWLRKGRKPPKWAIVYLIDTLELNFRLIGYMLDVKKSDFLILEITQLQKTMEDLRLENETVPFPPIKLDEKLLITDEKPINTSIIANLTIFIKAFIPNQGKCAE